MRVGIGWLRKGRLYRRRERKGKSSSLGYREEVGRFIEWFVVCWQSLFSFLYFDLAFVRLQ